MTKFELEIFNRGQERFGPARLECLFNDFFYEMLAPIGVLLQFKTRSRSASHTVF